FLPLIPVNPCVAGLPTDRDDVDLAVAVEIGRGQVLDRHAAVVDDVPGPFRAFAVRAFVDADAATFAGLHAQADAYAADQPVVAIAIALGSPDAMAPLQLLINDVADPLLLDRVVGLRVDNHLIAMPRLDGGAVFLAVLELALFDLAGAAIALGIGLVA